jgi:hypothetical protein
MRLLLLFLLIAIVGQVLSQSIVPIGNTTDYVQIGSKLVGTSEIGASQQGNAVAISADGTIMVVGAPNNNNTVGAIWVYGYDSATLLWIAVAGPLVPSDSAPSGLIGFGTSVAISANGLIIAVGGPLDNSAVGAVWIFVFDGVTTWTQQGSKLIGTGGNGSKQGGAVALSGDGTWLAVGGLLNAGGQVGVYIYNYNGTTWNQQVNPLKGLNLNPAYGGGFGTALSFSKDGRTLAVGVQKCNLTTTSSPPTTFSGCTLIYYRNVNSGMWSQAQSNLLFVYTNTSSLASVVISGDGSTVAAGTPVDDVTGFGSVCIYNISANPFTVYPCITINATVYGGSAADFGQSVALSHDGYTLAVGAPQLTSAIGGTFLFTNNGTQWIQTQAVLVGSSDVGAAQQGVSVSMSYDGKTFAVGGFEDNSGIGATWVFGIVPTPTPSSSFMTSPSTTLSLLFIFFTFLLMTFF